MIGTDQSRGYYVAYQKLHDLLINQYGPNHAIDILKECIKILQPYAEKERETTHV